LTQRTQRVFVDGKGSASIPVTSGVPQGTVCGPLLFSLFINDLPNCISSRAYLYADDLTIARKIDSLADVMAIQSDLDAIAGWCVFWGLEINTSKSCYSHITRRSLERTLTGTYTISGSPLAEVAVVKCLGVTIDNRLSWRQHVEDTARKARGCVIALNRYLRHCSTLVKSLAYTSLTRPILDYACVVWDPWTQRDIDKLECVQRLAARSVRSSWDRSSCVTSLINDLGWPSLQTRRKELRLSTFFNIGKGHTILNPDEFLLAPTYHGRHDHHGKVRAMAGATNTFRCSFFPSTIDAWNALPGDIAGVPTVAAFRKGLAILRAPILCSHSNS